MQEFCRRRLDSARENVRARQRVLKSSVTVVVALFEQTFPTLEAELAKTLPDA